MVTISAGLFQLTAARRRLESRKIDGRTNMTFQLTAARRRLVWHPPNPKYRKGFNSQPPEGGWARQRLNRRLGKTFQLTAARRRLVLVAARIPLKPSCFNSQPPEGGWSKCN